MITGASDLVASPGTVVRFWRELNIQRINQVSRRGALTSYEGIRVFWTTDDGRIATP
jgi:hypothetical protein